MRTKQQIALDETIWTPPDWFYCNFPLESEDQEIIELDRAIEKMQSLLDLIEPHDTVAAGYAAHVAHILVTMERPECRWHAVFNAKNGARVGDAYTRSPLTLMRRLTDILSTTEFDHVYRRAEKSL